MEDQPSVSCFVPSATHVNTILSSHMRSHASFVSRIYPFVSQKTCRRNQRHSNVKMNEEVDRESSNTLTRPIPLSPYFNDSMVTSSDQVSFGYDPDRRVESSSSHSVDGMRRVPRRDPLIGESQDASDELKLELREIQFGYVGDDEPDITKRIDVMSSLELANAVRGTGKGADEKAKSSSAFAFLDRTSRRIASARVSGSMVTRTIKSSAPPRIQLPSYLLQDIARNSPKIQRPVLRQLSKQEAVDEMKRLATIPETTSPSWFARLDDLVLSTAFPETVVFNGFRLLARYAQKSDKHFQAVVSYLISFDFLSNWYSQFKACVGTLSLSTMSAILDGFVRLRLEPFPEVISVLNQRFQDEYASLSAKELVTILVSTTAISRSVPESFFQIWFSMFDKLADKFSGEELIDVAEALAIWCQPAPNRFWKHLFAKLSEIWNDQSSTAVKSGKKQQSPTDKLHILSRLLWICGSLKVNPPEDAWNSWKQAILKESEPEQILGDFADGLWAASQLKLPIAKQDDPLINHFYNVFGNLFQGGSAEQNRTSGFRPSVVSVAEFYAAKAMNVNPDTSSGELEETRSRLKAEFRFESSESNENNNGDDHSDNDNDDDVATTRLSRSGPRNQDDDEFDDGDHFNQGSGYDADDTSTDREDIVQVDTTPRAMRAFSDNVVFVEILGFSLWALSRLQVSLDLEFISQWEQAFVVSTAGSSGAVLTEPLVAQIWSALGMADLCPDQSRVGAVLARRTERLVGSLNESELADILIAQARLHVLSSDALLYNVGTLFLYNEGSDLSEEIKRVMEDRLIGEPELDAERLSLLLWAFASSEIRPPKGFVKYLYEKFVQDPTQFGAEELSSVMWAIGRLRIRVWNKFLDTWYEQFYLRESEFTTKQLSDIICGFAKLRINPPKEFLVRWAKAVRSDLVDADPSSVASLLWSFAALSIKPASGFFKYWYTAALKHQGKYTVSELCNMIYAFGKLGIIPMDDFLEMFYASMDTLRGKFYPMALVTIFCSLARLKVRARQEVLDLWYQEYFRTERDFDCVYLGEAFWGFAIMEIIPRFDWVASFERNFERAQETANPPSLVNVMYGFSMLGLFPTTAFINLWYDLFEREQYYFTVRQILDARRGFERLKLRVRPIMDERAAMLLGLGNAPLDQAPNYDALLQDRPKTEQGQSTAADEDSALWKAGSSATTGFANPTSQTSSTAFVGANRETLGLRFKSKGLLEESDEDAAKLDLASSPMTPSLSTFGSTTRKASERNILANRYYIGANKVSSRDILDETDPILSTSKVRVKKSLVNEEGRTDLSDDIDMDDGDDDDFDEENEFPLSNVYDDDDESEEEGFSI